MKRLLSIVLFFIATAVSAQLDEGFYSATDTALAYQGDWVQVVDGDYVVMESTTQGDSVAFVVTGSQLVIYRDLLATGGAIAQICIEGDCDTFTNSATVDYRDVPISYSLAGEVSVTITNTDGGTLRLHSIMVWPSQLAESTAEPEPQVDYYQIDDEWYALRKEVTAGDIMTGSLLAGVIVCLMVLVVVVIWSR